MRCKILLFLLFTLYTFDCADAQIVDDFSDSNLTINPTWQGETGEFIVNSSKELQLMAPDAGNSLLMVQGNIPDSAIWQMKVRMEFSPSASNLLRILLISESNTLNSNGYYLEIGENGTTDALRMFRQDNGTATLIATGTPGLVGTDPVNIRLRIQRQSNGTWKASLATGNGSFIPQFEVTDATYSGGSNRWFGYYCLYTATRKDKFFFDDLSILPDLPDLQAPALVSASAQSISQVRVVFNEPLDSASVVVPVNYTLSGGVSVSTVSWTAAAPAEVLLNMTPSLTNGQTYTITCAGIRDVTGNTSGQIGTSFVVAVSEIADVSDIVINEFMADPSPSIGLPSAAEWIELINRSNKLIDLSTLYLNDGGGTPVKLPSFLLKPDSVVVLCTPTQRDALLPFSSRIAGVDGFPSLNNDADDIVLTLSNGTIIDQLSFSLDWHTDAAKRDGGWSLERINPDALCSGQDNWASCPLLPGGSLGTRNFSFNDAPDITAPKVEKVTVINANAITIQFSEGLDIGTVGDVFGYQIFPQRAIQSASAMASDRSSVVLILAEPLLEQTLYVLTFPTGSLLDCAGNPVSATDTTYLGLVEKPAYGDIVINEVLFNPDPNGARFVEIYNRSQKIFNFRDFFLANFFEGSDIDVIGKDRLFFPGTYIVFTPVTSDILARFDNVNASRLIANSVPTLGDTEGNITLYWSAQGESITVDSFDYRSDYHNPFFTVSDREGISLERIRIDGRTNSAENWTSAANKGTPTQPNSQLLPPVLPNGDEWISLAKNRLTPDDDGNDDFLDIQYTLPGTGFAVTMTIYDSEGIPIKKIVRQELLATTGGLRWNGDGDDGTRSRPGIHILFAEVFAPDGTTRRVRKVFALVR